ncbi:VOC family protein [Nonomuraea sp. NPDC049309]|uniref:VOC family protein n=1 Tax=Nonomuraea sp. NPDC049309 TaxID=3364350 RepID=UPI0037122F7F
MAPYYHVCFAVPDLAAAMRDLSAAAGVTWREPRDGRIGEWDYRIVFSAEGPAFIELIEAAPGGPWGDTSTPRFHHLGFWTSDVTAGAERLAASGFPETFSGCPYGRLFAYHRLGSVGADVELVDQRQQASFLEMWQPGGPPMPVIDEERA